MIKISIKKNSRARKAYLARVKTPKLAVNWRWIGGEFIHWPEREEYREIANNFVFPNAIGKIF